MHQYQFSIPGKHRLFPLHFTFTKSFSLKNNVTIPVCLPLNMLRNRRDTFRKYLFWLTNIPVIRHDISFCRLNSGMPSVYHFLNQFHTVVRENIHFFSAQDTMIEDNPDYPAPECPPLSSDTIIQFAAHLTAAVNGQHFPGSGQTPTVLSTSSDVMPKKYYSANRWILKSQTAFQSSGFWRWTS